MRSLAKYSLALQVAIAGVALAQVQTDPAVQGNTGTTAGQTGRVDRNANVGTIDDRSGVQDNNINRDKLAPAGTMRASKLIGAEVYNQQNKHLGEIKDIVLDKDNRKVGYVVLSYGGIAGLGDKLFALPRNMLQIAPDSSPTGQTKAIVALDEQTLKNAPGFDQNHWPTEANADYYRNLDRYYQEHGGIRVSQDVNVNRPYGKDSDAARSAGAQLDHDMDRAGDRLSNAGDKTMDTLKDAGRKTGDTLSDAGHKMSDSLKSDKSAQPAAAQMGSEGNLTWNHRVSELLGANVKSPQDENLGEINDLVIDWPGGQVRYAVLSYGGLLGMGDKLFAVPIEQFQPRDKNLVLSIDKQQLKNAPGFDKNHWPDVADPTWSKSVDQFYQQHGTVGHGNVGQGDLTR